MTDAQDMDLARDFARNNSEAAFTELVRRHINLVYSVALRFTRHAGDAEDVAQAVFCILAQKAGSLGPKTILTGWLYETTRFTAMKLLRTKARQHTREQEAYMQSHLSEPDAAWKQLAPVLEEGMSRLGEKDRTLLALRFFENRTHAETAAILGMQESAAAKRANRAVEKLRRFFSKRGIFLPAGILVAAISANSVQAAPPALANTVTLTAAAKGAVVSAPTLTLIKGALKLMVWTKAKTAAVAAVVILTVGTPIVVYVIHQQREQATFNLKYVNAFDAVHVLADLLPGTPANGAAVWKNEGTVVIGNTRLIATHSYNGTDSIRVIGPPEIQEIARQILDKLDQQASAPRITAANIAPAPDASVVIMVDAQSPGGNRKITIKIKGDKARLDQTGRGDAESAIFDSNTGGVIILEHGLKKFMKMPKDIAKAMNDVGGNPKIVDTGKQEKVGEYNTEIYTTELFGGKDTIWVTKDIPNYASIWKQMEVFEIPVADPSDESKQMGAIFPDTSKIDGMPVKMEIPMGKKATSVVTIMSAKEEPVDDAEFQIPADYTEKPWPGEAIAPPAASPAPDTSTPKKAALVFAKAIEAGDMPTARSVSIGTDADLHLFKLLSDTVVAMKAFSAASVEKFGDQGKLPEGMTTSLSSQLEAMDEKIDGDNATLISKRSLAGPPPTLKKTAAGWVMDLTNTEKDPSAAGMTQILPLLIKAYTTGAANIKAGKYASAHEAMDAVMQLAAPPAGGGAALPTASPAPAAPPN